MKKIMTAMIAVAAILIGQAAIAEQAKIEPKTDAEKVALNTCTAKGLTGDALNNCYKDETKKESANKTQNAAQPAAASK